MKGGSSSSGGKGKRSSGGGGGGRNSGGGGGGSANSGPSGPTPCVLKYLAPAAMAAAVIGKGGTVISAMRESCQAKLALTEQGDYFPTTDCRILTAQAATEEAINEVSKQIIAKLAELEKGNSTAETTGTKAELKIRLPVPRAAVGGVIGKGGASIKQIRETSGATIAVSEALGNGPSAEQLVSVAGSAAALEQVLTEINRQVQLLNTESWFAAWATGRGSTQLSYGGILGQAGSSAFGSPGIETMMRVAQGLPPYVMEDSRGFAMSCVVPEKLVGGLIGRGGQGTKEVQNTTGTKISIREIPDDPENRSLNIAGPLANTCAAYMLMMKRYLDAEHQANPANGQSAPR